MAEAINNPPRRNEAGDAGLAAGGNKDGFRQKVKKAKEWADKIKSTDVKTRNEAFAEAEQAKYADGLSLALAKEHVAQAEAAPSWIQTTIHECPQAAECIAQIAQLPPELQSDANVLYFELGKLNKSVNWEHASAGARKEARVVQDKILSRIAEVAKNDPTFGDTSRDILLSSIDPTRVHLEVITTVQSAGTEPADKKSAEHDQWADKKALEEQNITLQRTVDMYQQLLDSPQNQSPQNQRKQLENFLNDLRNGMTRTQRVNNTNRDSPQLNIEDALRHTDTAQKRLNELNNYISQQEQIQHEEQYGIKRITTAQLNEQSWFVATELSASAQQALRDNKEFVFRDHWTEADVDYLLKHGYRDWFYRYADQVFGLGTERVQPTLAEQYKWEDFRNFIRGLYGAEAAVIEAEFQKHWEDRSRYDYIIHAMGLGYGDNKDRLKAMSMFESSDVDYVMHTFEHAPLAYSFMERETFNVMADRMATYERTKAWLAESTKNDFYMENAKDARKRVLEAYSDLGKTNPADIDKLVKLYQSKNLRRDQYIRLLDAEQLIQPAEQFAKYQPLHTELTLKRDDVARGVVLEDMDVWGYVDVEIDYVRTSEKLLDLQLKKTKGELTKEEKENFEETVKSLQLRQRDLFERKGIIIKDHPELEGMGDPTKQIKLLSDRKGLSVIENKVYDDMLDYLRAKNGGKEPNPTDIRMAIWAARINIMATGRMAAIGAMMARMPGGDREYHKTAQAKDIMRAPAFEDLVRIMNPEMFAARFGMGGDEPGEMGVVMRAYFRFNSRRNKMEGGQSKAKKSFFDSDEWKELKSEMHEQSAQTTMKLMEFAEKNLGIKFSELLATGFMATGAQYDGSSWRLSKGVLDELKAHYLKLRESKNLPDKAILDNQALAIRFLIARNPEERRHVLDRMTRRTPMRFFQLLADRQDVMLKEVSLAPESWSAFENALKYAETDLWKNPTYAFKDIDLGSKKDFNEIVKPYLKTQLERKQLPATDADIEKYRKLIEVMQNHLAKPVHGGPYESILDGLARESLPLTLSLDDFNWGDAHMAVLGNLAFPRRTRDIGNMEQARNILLAFFSNQENILFPADIKEPIKKLVELKIAIEAYAGTPQADKVVKQMSQLLIEANRDRSLWSLPSFLPGGKSIGLWLAEQDVRSDAQFRGKFAKAAYKGIGKAAEFTLGNVAKLSSKVKPVESVLNWMMPGWKGFSQEPFEKWPHSIAEAISWGVKFTGAHGNRWDEKQIDEVLHQFQRAGLFANHPEYIHDMRGEFKAGSWTNFWAVGRRYWWVIVLATLAVAIMAQVEEEKKKGGH